MVARLYPSDNPSSGCFRKRSIYAASHGDHGSRRGGSFNGQGRGRGCGRRIGRGRGRHFQGGHVGGSGAHENGIEISYVTHYFDGS